MFYSPNLTTVNLRNDILMDTSSTSAASKAHTASYFIRTGYREVTPGEAKQVKQFIKANMDPVEALSRMGDKVFVSRLRTYPNIFGVKMVTDILAYDKKKFPKGILLDAKYQGVSGSVDEKLPFAALSLVAHDTFNIIVLDGGAFRPAADNWLLKYASYQAKQYDRQLLVFTTLGDFIAGPAPTSFRRPKWLTSLTRKPCPILARRAVARRLTRRCCVIPTVVHPGALSLRRCLAIRRRGRHWAGPLFIPQGQCCRGRPSVSDSR